MPFYERCGFVRAYRIPGFFTDHYDHPIFEGGVQLTDMVVLAQNSPAPKLKRPIRATTDHLGAVAPACKLSLFPLAFCGLLRCAQQPFFIAARGPPTRPDERRGDPFGVPKSSPPAEIPDQDIF